MLLGIDDAGRGPLIGPMILAGVLIKQNDEQKLKKLGAKDSKLLYHKERIRIAQEIKKAVIKHSYVLSFPEEIDDFVFSGLNLNTLEAKKTADLINELNTKKDKIKVIVDCPSVNISAWKSKLISFIEHKENLEIICEHKADFNHPVVSAASIIAKVIREDQINILKKKYGDFGSGYPSDPITKKFLVENGKKLKDSGIFRKSWQTWKHMFPTNKQKSLKDY